MTVEMQNRLTFNWARLESLTAVQWHKVLQARAEVFVVEQSCAYQDPDDLDAHAWHLQLFCGGQLAAYARVVDAGCKYEEPSIGRVMTVPAFRGQKLGRTRMVEAIRWTQLHNPCANIQISAQAYLQRFYESIGFHGMGDVYDEDGIPHLQMLRPRTVKA